MNNQPEKNLADKRQFTSQVSCRKKLLILVFLEIDFCLLIDNTAHRQVLQMTNINRSFSPGWRSHPTIADCVYSWSPTSGISSRNRHYCLSLKSLLLTHENKDLRNFTL